MDDEKEFTIRDRRSNAPGPDALPDRDPPSAARQEDTAGTASSAGTGTAPPNNEGSELDFAAFVISLATSAQISLGAIPHPETNQPAVNFPAAKQMIDIIAMLKEKTKGNLSKDEAGLLDQVLFNLRMHYVRTVEGQKKAGGG